jgi:hypothetical protein
MCAVLLPPGVNPIAVNKYIRSYMYITSSVRMLQNTLRMIIVTNGLILDVYQKSSRFWEDFAEP